MVLEVFSNLNDSVKEGRFRLDMSKTFFTMRVMRRWEMPHPWKHSRPG